MRGFLAAAALALLGSACAASGVGGGSSSGGSSTGGGPGGSSTGADDAGGMTCYSSYGTITCPPGYYCNDSEPTCFQLAGGGTTGARAGSSSGGGSSGGTSTGGGGGCDGSSQSNGPFITVTLQRTGLHPAEVAAMAALGLTPPSPVGEQISIQGIALCNLVPTYWTLGSVTITAQNQNGPIVFPHLNVGGVNLGVIASYQGVGTVNGVPVQPPTCAQLRPDGGYTDYVAASASEVYVGTPTADITVPAAYAISWDYASLLDCAQGFTPGSLLSNGFVLLYATDAAFTADGGLAGVAFQQVPAAGSIGYYAAGYGAAAAGATSANGVATLSGATEQLLTVSASAPGETFASHELAAIAQTCYQVYFTPQ
jgi:hypothetical protein